MRTLLLIGIIILIFVVGGAILWKPSTVGSVSYWRDFVWTPAQEAPREGGANGGVVCTKEAKICPDGSTVGRVGPSCEFASCPSGTSSNDAVIVIDTPEQGATVTSPITVTGKARGNWYFEGSFPITVVNWDGLIVGQGTAKATSDWMTTDYVPFVAAISYTLSPGTPYNRGTLILKKDNPSGLPENDDSREIPVLFSEVQ